jgi:hypothetical protein
VPCCVRVLFRKRPASDMAAPQRREIILNVYDISGESGATWLRRVGMGMYHSGVEVSRYSTNPLFPRDARSLSITHDALAAQHD